MLKLHEKDFAHVSRGQWNKSCTLSMVCLLWVFWQIWQITFQVLCIVFQLIHISQAAPVPLTLHQRASCPLSRSTWLAEPVVIRVILEASATVRASTRPRRWNAEINMQRHDGRRPRRPRKRKLRLWNNWWVIMGRKWELDDVWNNTLSPGKFQSNYKNSQLWSGKCQSFAALYVIINHDWPR